MTPSQSESTEASTAWACFRMSSTAFHKRQLANVNIDRKGGLTSTRVAGESVVDQLGTLVSGAVPRGAFDAVAFCCAQFDFGCSGR